MHAFEANQGRKMWVTWSKSSPSREYLDDLAVGYVHPALLFDVRRGAPVVPRRDEVLGRLPEHGDMLGVRHDLVDHIAIIDRVG